KGEASGIISWHPDRLARNSIDGGKVIYLVDTGKIIDLKFPTYRFDSSAQGKFMLNIIFGQSKYYVDNLSENTKRGLREKVRLGEYPSLAPIGYTNDRSKIIVDEANAPLVKKLYALCAEGRYSLLELRKLATAFGLVSKRQKKPLSFSNVHRILTNPFYYGLFLYKGEIFQGTHSPIIDKDLFDKVQEVIKFRSKPILNKNHYFVFRGFIRCGECGCQITAEIQRGHAYYHCTKKRGPCAQSKYVREENLAQQVKEAIDKVALDDGLFSPMMKELEREKTLLEADKIFAKRNAEIKLKEIEEKLKTLLDLFMDNTISVEEYREKKAQLLNQKVELERNPLTQDGKWLEQMKSFLTLAHQATSIAAEANFEAQRDFLRSCGSNISLNNGSLAISYRYPWRYIVENRGNKKWGG
ncbi:MAG: recombinase family protein, partial [Candidatus Omnitrophica bacterium]|nr:recombinase family protein [Candidatus Omnitrophota bacterium]